MIVYLGGYKDPWGQIRQFNDFEVGTREKSNAYEDIDEAKNHLGDREYATYNGWKSACRKAYPGCTFYGDRDIGGANLNGKDVGEWDGSVGCVYNDSMSGIAMAEGELDEAKAPTLASRIKNAVHADQIGRNKDGNYVFRKGYFYRNGMDSDKWAQRVADQLAKAGLKATLIDSYDHWAAFRGGAGVKASSHFAAIFRIEDSAPAQPVTEREDDEPRLAWGQRDWEMDSEMNPYDDYLRYRADGGTLSRDDWEFDKEHGGSDELTEAGPVRDPLALQVKKIATDLLGTPYSTARIAGGTVYRISIPLRGFAHPQQYHSGGRFDEMLPEDKAMLGKIKQKLMSAVAAAGLDTSMVDVRFHRGSGIYASVRVKLRKSNYLPQTTTESRKPKNLDDAIRKYGHEHPKTVKAAEREEKKETKKKVKEGLEPTPSTNAELLGKLAKTINSCTSLDQLKSAERFSNSVFDKIADRMKKKHGFGSYKDVTTLMNQIDHDIRKKRRELSSVTESAVKAPTTIILEGVKFRVSDPKLAKVLRRFPHESMKIDAGGELDDRLYDALYDHYLNNGEMPYGVAKARDGDPYEWVSDKITTDLSSRNDVFAEGEGIANPEIEEIFDKYPHEAKLYRETGELDDGPLYEELFDHYCNNGEMPYGVAKARDGDPVQWIANQLERDLGQGLNEAGDDYKEFDSSFDDEEELDEALTPAQQERMERMKAQDAEWAKVKGSVESGQKGYRNPFASDSATARGDELTWRSQQLAKSGKASGGLAFEDSVDGNALKENMTVSIQADGEEDVLSVIRKLSGMSDVASATPAPVGIPSALAVIDSIQADDYDTPASEFNIGEFGDTVEDDFAPEEEVEECYANTPEPEEQIGLSTTIANAGNEPGRRAYTAGNAVTESKIVRQYSKGQK